MLGKRSSHDKHESCKTVSDNTQIMSTLEIRSTTWVRHISYDLMPYLLKIYATSTLI